MARKRWRLRHRGGELQIEVDFGIASARKDSESSRREVDALLWRGLTARDPEVRRVLDAIHRDLRGISAPGGGLESHGPDYEHSLAADLRFAAHSGRLRVARVEPMRGTRSAVSSVEKRLLGPEPEPERVHDPAPSAWIAIVLLGEDGNPIPGEEYRITFPDGSTRTGALNRAGKAMIRAIRPGECGVTFPRLDKEIWSRA